MRSRRALTEVSSFVANHHTHTTDEVSIDLDFGLSLRPKRFSSGPMMSPFVRH